MAVQECEPRRQSPTEYLPDEEDGESYVHLNIEDIEIVSLDRLKEMHEYIRDLGDSAFEKGAAFQLTICVADILYPESEVQKDDVLKQRLKRLVDKSEPIVEYSKLGDPKKQEMGKMLKKMRPEAIEALDYAIEKYNSYVGNMENPGRLIDEGTSTLTRGVLYFMFRPPSSDEEEATVSGV